MLNAHVERRTDDNLSCGNNGHDCHNGQLISEGEGTDFRIDLLWIAIKGHRPELGCPDAVSKQGKIDNTGKWGVSRSKRSE